MVLFLDDGDHIGGHDDMLRRAARIEQDDEFAIARVLDEISLHGAGRYRRRECGTSSSLEIPHRNAVPADAGPAPWPRGYAGRGVDRFGLMRQRFKRNRLDFLQAISVLRLEFLCEGRGAQFFPFLSSLSTISKSASTTSSFAALAESGGVCACGAPSGEPAPAAPACAAACL